MRKNKNIFKENGGNFSPIEIIRLIITVNKMWDKDFFVSSLLKLSLILFLKIIWNY